ncbi:uncharacterized protein CCOS01_15417 [Colletotrichum costaricense]|uniref:Amidohydrolase 3 domain-containing protein n=1 Tax=Colletotrichum costaricense TaxID=1209916 RepID=A0AAI9YH83_9PEZI|nr:uncharacterized protein CCOS01_15417 [Colletotrichum costaricense]KAK1509323.1 hypothetical protein CCOS01_15417 [Colletotrichum costaricense]
MATFYSSKTDNNALAYVDGRVFTMNDHHPWAEAFIVSPSGVFEAVGTTEYIKTIASRRGLIICSLGDRFVMPGIHDGHTHLLFAGYTSLYHTEIGRTANANTIANLLEKSHCLCKYTNVMGEWIIGNYYVSNLFPDGLADRRYLDVAYPDKPVLVREISGHKVLVNSAGLRYLGLDPNTAVEPEGGVYSRRPDGSMTGELKEVATGVAWLNMPVPPLSAVKKAMVHSIKTCHMYGITSVQEASANTLYLHALRELEDDNELNLDICTHIVCKNEFFPSESNASLEALLDVSEAFKSKHVDTRYVKFWLDGSPLEPGSTHSCLGLDGEPDRRMLLLDDETLLAAVKKYDGRGMTVKMHAAGEGSIRQALNVYEAVRKENPNGPRHEVAHSNAIHPDDFARLASLRVTAEMSPSVFDQVDELAADVLRFEFNQVHKAGGLCTFGTDWPVTENPNLLQPLAALLDKVTVDPVPLAKQLKTQKEFAARVICRAITLGAAENLDKGTETGSIETGKKANFIMVNQDLSKGEFSGAIVQKTWFEGRLVWDIDGEFKVSI